MRQNKLRFILVLFTLMVIGFMATSLTSYYVAHDSLSEQITETALPLTSDNIYSEIQQDLLRPIFISSLMAQDTFVRDWTLSGEEDPQQIVRYLKEIQNRYNTVTSFFVSDKTKKYYHPKGVIKTLSSDDTLDHWYYAFLKSQKEYEVNVDSDTANPSRLTVFINYRVFDYVGNFIGVTGVGLDVTKVQELVKTYQKRYGRRVSFINREGTIMLSNTDAYTGSSIRNTSGLDKIATQILTTPSGSFSYEHDGKVIQVNARLVPEFQWYLLVEQEESVVETKITNNLISNIAISIVICVVILFLTNLTLSRYQKRLEEMATTDSLTGVSNRHIFNAIFEQIVKNSMRHKHAVSLAMLDIDHFKKVNDTYGHAAGDVALKSVVSIIQERLRDSDTICRWGGEEFLILLPDCDVMRANKIANDIRTAVEQHTILIGNHDIHLTVSIGVSEYIQNEPESSLINRIDEALYRSKNAGRNTVSIGYPAV
jgi:diguanylate cyclase (GGDEF)-like protein